MFTRNTARAILALCILSLALCGAFYALGRATPLPYNPYTALLSTPISDIYTLSRCYPELPMYSASYCIQDAERGYIAFSVANDAVKYLSVSGALFDVRIGDLIAIYGQPTRTYRNRFYATYHWQGNGFRVVASSRRDSVFELVLWIMVSASG